MRSAGRYEVSSECGSQTYAAERCEDQAVECSDRSECTELLVLLKVKEEAAACVCGAVGDGACGRLIVAAR